MKKKASKKPASTHIAIVLDRSGSMQSVRDDTIGGFNAFLREQQAVKGKCTLTLAQFDDKYEIVHDAKAIADVPELNAKTFVPRGSTALLDAIGRTINATDAAKSDKCIFVILTDGQENASREFTKAKVLELIKDHKKWQFVYLGANQDAIQGGEQLGISGSNSMTFAANAGGTQAVYSSLSNSMRDFRIGASGSVSFSAEDRLKQTKAGA